MKAVCFYGGHKGMEVAELKREAGKEIDSIRQRLKAVSLEIHSNPELGFKEEKAAALLCKFLEENGFSVERGICQVPTSFRASYGKGKPHIGILAEYDALPDIGHACGHNLIATAAVGAAVAARRAADELGGSIIVTGTPAEEIYGGKVIMAKRGAFDNLDTAMMIHPGTNDVATTQALACQGIDVEFFGRASHAAAAPEHGINALDAMILSFNGINALRQHIRSTARIHGIITDGGQATNVVPAHSAGSFLVRSKEKDYFEELKEKVLDCFIAAAKATGARLEYKWQEVWYDPMRNNLSMARLFADNMGALGRNVELLDTKTSFGSTDMGNVSQLVPSIHAFVAVTDKDIQGHTTQFAEVAASEEGLKGALDAAKAMAMTAIDLLADPEVLAAVKEEFRQGK
jgi:amidohydrolase